MNLEVYLESASSHQAIHYRIYYEISGDSVFKEDFIYDYIVFPIFQISHFEENHKGEVDEIKNEEVLDQVRRYFRSQARLNTALDNYHKIQMKHLLSALSLFSGTGVSDFDKI